MIIVKTPLRFSFFGGGTDLPAYYKRGYGCVLGQAINKYVYVIINKRFEKSIRISYSENEIVNNVSQIKHNLIRESLKKFKIQNNVEIVTIADVPGTGTGLGSSSSLSVGLCKSLSVHLQQSLSKKQIVEQAYEIEIFKHKNPIGKQDHYFATYGGILFLKFEYDDTVRIERLKLSKNSKKELQQNIIAFYTGFTRNSKSVLMNQNKETEKNLKKLDAIREFAESGRELLRNDNLSQFGKLLDKNWQLKKLLAPNVTNSVIDSMYKKAIRAGAAGGKLSGAGNGGFLFLYCEPRYQKHVRESLRGYAELSFGIDENGTIRLSEV